MLCKEPEQLAMNSLPIPDCLPPAKYTHAMFQALFSKLLTCSPARTRLSPVQQAWDQRLDSSNLNALRSLLERLTSAVSPTDHRNILATMPINRPSAISQQQ
jgi:hypothetical protein